MPLKPKLKLENDTVEEAQTVLYNMRNNNFFKVVLPMMRGSLRSAVSETALSLSGVPAPELLQLTLVSFIELLAINQSVNQAITSLRCISVVHQ